MSASRTSPFRSWTKSERSWPDTPLPSGASTTRFPSDNGRSTAWPGIRFFNFNPDLFWDADSTDQKATLPAGPNNPVGVVWIDLSKPHYGLHGTPDPETIGRAQTHGCIRLTNWDALELSQLVSVGTPVVLER